MLLKDRPLLLLRALQEGSDDEKWMTTAELRAVLEAEGQVCAIRTLRRDIQIEAFSSIVSGPSKFASISDDGQRHRNRARKSEGSCWFSWWFKH